MRAARIALLVLLANGAGGCLLFTDTVNSPPAVEIQGPAQLHRGEEATFSAVVTDSTGGARTFDWARGPSCPPDLASADEGGRTRGESSFLFQQLDPAPDGVCLWVIVTDAEGARGLATWKVGVLDRELQLNSPATVVSGQPVTFTAEYRSEPGATGRSRFSWAMATSLDATCEDAEVAARSSPGELGRTDFLYEKAQRVPFCVAVVARDEFGIERQARLPVTAVRIAPPPAKIRPVPRAATIAAGEGPLGIFTDVRLAAADEGELAPDELLEFSWKITRPDGTTMVPSACPDARPAGSEVCFAPDRRGSYRVDLAVADDSQRSTAAPFSLAVVDRAPCIRNSEPRFSSAPKFYELYDRERVLKVNEVNDDGDPWPTLGRATQRAFRWSIRKLGPGAPRFERRVSAIFDTFTIPAREYQPGDQIEVRFEYWDRLDLEDPQARDFSTRCKPDDRLCELQPGSGCYQWITWTVEYL